MTDTLPDSLTREDVLFQWSLSEAYSPRWQADYVATLPPALLEKIRVGDPSLFSSEDKDALIALLEKRRAYMVETYINEADHFRLIDVPVEMLELIPVMPSFSWKDDPVPLGHYMDWDRSPEWKDDPRNHAADQLKGKPPAAPFRFYPILAYSFQTRCDVIIEGYVRCITNLSRKRAGERAAPLRMVYCEVEQSRRLPGFYKP